MKAEDLRIGNKLQKDNGEIFTVLRLDNTNDVLVEEQRGLLTLDYNLFGIVLTEEWLLKFGFKAESNYSNYILNGIEITSSLRIIATNERKRFWLDGEIPDAWKISLDHIHQLQNLYFALTGTELQITK